MTLLIKQGHRYLRRDGKIEGPMPEPEWDAHKVAHAFKGPQSGMWYLPDGTVAGFSCDDQDLLSELEEPSSPESVEDEVTEAGLVAGEAYQVIGSLSHYANMFDHPEVQRALDWFSGFEPGVTYKDDASILPWPKEELKADHAPSWQHEISTELATENAELAALVKELEGALGDLVAVCERNISPKPDVGPEHPWSVLKQAQAALAKKVC